MKMKRKIGTYENKNMESRDMDSEGFQWKEQRIDNGV